MRQGIEQVDMKIRGTARYRRVNQIERSAVVDVRVDHDGRRA